ncbi:MAG: LVIVD repeat-containing protein [Candidatus Hodarchaeales archaeon]|jgi:hypothetical protein
MTNNRKLTVLLLAVTVLFSFTIHINGTPQVILSSSATTVQEFNPVEIGQLVTGGVVSDIQVIDNTVYVADESSGLVIIDVSDPENPVRTGSYSDGTGSPMDICIVNELAFVADGSDGLEIIDISDSTNPVEIGNFYDGGRASGVSVMGEHAFVADRSDGLEVIDISDPENPIEVANYYLSGSYKEVFLKDDQAFIVNLVVNEGRIEISELNVLNISDINNIVETGSIGPGYGNCFYYSYVSGNNGYFSTHGFTMGISILNIGNLPNLWKIGGYSIGEGTPNKMDVRDDIIYFACGYAGLKIINVTDISNPVEITSYYDGGYAYDVQVVDNLAYVADRLDGLEIIQLHDNVEDSSTSRSTDSSTSRNTGDTVISGYELPVVLFVLISSFHVRKRKKDY